METEHDNDIVKKTKSDARDTAEKTEGLIVKEEAESDNDVPPPSGGLKAWLYAFATFLMFISAW